MTQRSGESVAVSKTPTRLRQRKTRVVTSGITWLPPEQVAGAVLSAETQRHLAEHAEAWRRRGGAARVRGASYVIH